MNTILVVWTDQDGKQHQKDYGLAADKAYKARLWLIERGAIEVDVVITKKD